MHKIADSADFISKLQLQFNETSPDERRSSFYPMMGSTPVNSAVLSGMDSIPLTIKGLADETKRMDQRMGEYVKSLTTENASARADILLMEREICRINEIKRKILRAKELTKKK